MSMASTEKVFRVDAKNANVLIAEFHLDAPLRMESFTVKILGKGWAPERSPGIIFTFWAMDEDTPAGFWILPTFQYIGVVTPDTVPVSPIMVTYPCGALGACEDMTGARFTIPEGFELNAGDHRLVVGFSGAAESFELVIEDPPPLRLERPWVGNGCSGWSLEKSSSSLGVHAFTGPGASIDTTMVFKTDKLVFGLETGLLRHGTSSELLIAPDGSERRNHEGIGIVDRSNPNWDGSWFGSSTGAGFWRYSVTGMGSWDWWPGFLVCTAPDQS